MDTQKVAEEAVEQLGELDVSKKDTQEDAMLVLEKEHLTATHTLLGMILEMKDRNLLSSNDMVKLLMYTVAFPLELRVPPHFNRYVLTQENTTKEMQALLKWIVHLRDITFNYTMNNAMKHVFKQVTEEKENEQKNTVAE